MTYIEKLGQNARKASKQLLDLQTKEKNSLLKEVGKALILNSDTIISENQKDLKEAKNNGISDIMIDRLALTRERIKAISEGLYQVADLKDPIGEVIQGFTNIDGLEILQKRVPLGVIAMIFESRPNVSIDAFSLAFKTNNAIILRGGRDAINSNKALITVVRTILEKHQITPDVVQLVEDTSYEVAEELMRATDYIDVLIPRGSARLIQTVKEKAKVPFIETGLGNVHIYVDSSADLEMAVEIVINAKTQRPSVCNAAESLVLHQDIASEFLKKLELALKPIQPVEFRADKRAFSYLSQAILATSEDFEMEFLDYIMSVNVVDNLDEAIDWINKYSSKHSESILTQDLTHAKIFQDKIDSSAVYVNASTRFTDGFVFGFGAEIGISTQKLHARGPMGLEALTTCKYYISGNGQIRK